MTTSGGKLISQMKLVSVRNMSPSGMQLHFYSLTLRVLKLISWTCRFAEAPAAGCELSAMPAQKTFSSSHLIHGLDLITDLSWTTSATAVQSPFFHVFFFNLHKADGILAWVSSDSPSALYIFWAHQGWFTAKKKKKKHSLHAEPGS